MVQLSPSVPRWCLWTMQDWGTHHGFPPAHWGGHKRTIKSPTQNKSGACGCQGKGKGQNPSDFGERMGQIRLRPLRLFIWASYSRASYWSDKTLEKMDQITHTIHLLAITDSVPKKSSAMTHQKSHITVTLTPSVLSLQSTCFAWCVSQRTLGDGGTWLQQTACAKPSETNPWPFFPGPQALVCWNSTFDLWGRWKLLRCLTGSPLQLMNLEVL